MSDRQDRWREASDKAAREGSDFAALIFRAIAEPNDQERKADTKPNA